MVADGYWQFRPFSSSSWACATSNHLENHLIHARAKPILHRTATTLAWTKKSGSHLQLNLRINGCPRYRHQQDGPRQDLQSQGCFGAPKSGGAADSAQELRSGSEVSRKFAPFQPRLISPEGDRTWPMRVSHRACPKPDEAPEGRGDRGKGGRFSGESARPCRGSIVS